jgi:hypothetical protein
LARLEDHTILRGTLAAFDLDDAISARVETFEAIFEPEHWPALTGALLATGEYQRDYPGSDQHRFGSPSTEGVWRLLLVDRGDHDALSRVRSVLGKLLDRVASSPEAAAASLESVAAEFVEEREAGSHFDWRYHLVRYPEMREGSSGIYYGADGRLGYELTMLSKLTQASWYRDAFLYAIWCEAGRPSEVKDPWFTGYSTHPRWMTLVRSGIALRSVPAGIAVQPPTAPSSAGGYEAVLGSAGAVLNGEGWLLPIPQAALEGVSIDTVDRVRKTSDFLQKLIAAGL